MEFSEAYELNNLLKVSKSGQTKNPFVYDSNITQEAIDKMLEYAESLEDCLVYSPPNSIPVAEPRKDSDSNTQPEATTQPSCKEDLEDYPTQIEVQKDESYMESFAQSIGKVSSLTASIMYGTPELQASPDLMSLRIYLFETQNYLDVQVPKHITVEQLASKVISAYVKSELEEPLPNGTAPEAYEVWLVDDDSLLPEKDFTVEKTMKVRDLAVDCLAFCAVPGYEHQELPAQETPWRRVSEITNGITLKVCFEENWTVISVSPQVTLRDLLGQLERKFAESGYLKPEEFEFKIKVSLEDAIQQEECIVDMDLQVNALGTTELKLCRKVYADSPPEEEPVRKSFSVSKEEAKYDPLRFHMTKAQACAYQEYGVIKTNKRGKRQKRIIGIDQTRILNMTEAQAKQALKRQASASQKNVMKSKLKGLFMSITHHREIPITNILSITQDSTNLSSFFLEYIEEGVQKKKKYDTENSTTTAEVVAKVAKLIQLNAPDK